MRTTLPEIESLFGGLPTAAFVGGSGALQPVKLSPGGLAAATEGFDRRELLRIVTHGCLDRRDLRIVREGAGDGERMIFDAQGVASLTAVTGAYADGFTVVLNNLQRRSRGVAFLTRSLELALYQPVGANAYWTPPSARGLAPHFDDHDVFVLQLEGEKTWHVHAALRELPLRGEQFELGAQDIGPERFTFRLVPGDVLFLPRGWVHHAATGALSSLHLTLGVSAYRRADLLARVATLKARDTVALREALSLREAPGAGAGTALSVDAGDLERFGARALQAIEIDFIATLGPLEDGGVDALDAPESIGLDTRLRHRVGSLVCVEDGAADVRLHFPGNVVVCPPAAREALAFIAAHRSFAPRDLPAPLTDASRLALARKLSAAGLLVPRDAG